MSESGNERPITRPWKIYSSSNEAPSWKGLGTTTSSMNAVSFGFMATAILISLFLIMAILEHLFRPHDAPTLPAASTNLPAPDRSSLRSQGSSSSKLGIHQQPETTSFASGISVLMPGEKYPTRIAKPAPLLPCTREGIHWSSQQHSSFAPHS